MIREKKTCPKEGLDSVLHRKIFFYYVVVRARWTVYIGLDSSVVEHLNSDAGVPSLIPGPAIYFHLYFFVFVHSSHPYYNYAFDLEKLFKVAAYSLSMGSLWQSLSSTWP